MSVPSVTASADETARQRDARLVRIIVVVTCIASAAFFGHEALRGHACPLLKYKWCDGSDQIDVSLMKLYTIFHACIAVFVMIVLNPNGYCMRSRHAVTHEA